MNMTNAILQVERCKGQSTTHLYECKRSKANNQGQKVHKRQGAKGQRSNTDVKGQQQNRVINEHFISAKQILSIVRKCNNRIASRLAHYSHPCARAHAGAHVSAESVQAHAYAL